MATRIAVIDDDVDILTLLQELLTEEGYEAPTVQAGTAAYPHVRQLAPALIILDISTESQTTGWELLERMHRDSVLHATPVIVSAADAPGLTERRGALEARGDTILIKPFELSSLLALVEQLTGGSGSGAPPSSQSPR